MTNSALIARRSTDAEEGVYGQAPRMISYTCYENTRLKETKKRGYHSGPYAGHDRANKTWGSVTHDGASTSAAPKHNLTAFYLSLKL